MQTENLEMERAEAARMWRKYREHKAHAKPIDHEIERIYHAIALGKIVIRAIASVSKAGLGDDGLPKLAIVRADAEQCFCRMTSDGAARMADASWIYQNASRSRYVDFSAGSFASRVHRSGVAMVPHIPPDIRPARGLANYHILFEAVWSPVPPRDPMLLRRLGHGDTWLVCGAWNLTEIERAAMADRIGVTA